MRTRKFERQVVKLGKGTLAISFPVLEVKRTDLEAGDIIEISYKIICKGVSNGKPTN